MAAPHAAVSSANRAAFGHRIGHDRPHVATELSTAAPHLLLSQNHHAEPTARALESELQVGHSAPHVATEPATIVPHTAAQSASAMPKMAASQPQPNHTWLHSRPRPAARAAEQPRPAAYGLQ